MYLKKHLAKMISHKSLCELSAVRKTTTLDFWSVDFELFKMLVGKIPWESVLKSKGFRKAGCFSRRKS